VEEMMNMLLAKKTVEQRRAWLEDKGDLVEAV
jgi:hypothetical protein